MTERRRRLNTVQAALHSTSIPPGANNALSITNTSEVRELEDHLHEIASQLTGTRQILLRESLDALDVSESSIPGCRFQIASLPVPPLSELQGEHKHAPISACAVNHVVLNSLAQISVIALSKQQLNATLSLLVLLVKLLSAYLGIQLPLVLCGTSTKPLIRALSGTTNALRCAFPLALFQIVPRAALNSDRFAGIQRRIHCTCPRAPATPPHPQTLQHLPLRQPRQQVMLRLYLSASRCSDIMPSTCTRTVASIEQRLLQHG